MSGCDVQMWRVRLCLAGGGREHVGYFNNEHDGAMAYQLAVQRKESSARQMLAGHSATVHSDLLSAGTPQHLPLRQPLHSQRHVEAVKVGDRGATGHSAEGSTSGAFSHVLPHDSRSGMKPDPSSISAMSQLFHEHINPSRMGVSTSSALQANSLLMNLGLHKISMMPMPAPTTSRQFAHFPNLLSTITDSPALFCPPRQATSIGESGHRGPT